MAIRKLGSLRVTPLPSAVALFLLVAIRSLAQPCEVDSPCMRNGMCMPDGSCVGTPIADGTACNDQNPCTTNDRCQAGECFGSPVANGTPCTDWFGNCTTGDRCMFGFCVGDWACGDDGNACTLECDIERGVCATIVVDFCNTDCATGECDPETGECINVVNRPDGTRCDDFNECTTNDRCVAGTCLGGSMVEPTTPPTQRTPTPTPTHAGPGTPTPTSSRAPCVGDCNGDGQITVDELVKGVNIALGNNSLNECRSFDSNGDAQVTVDELIGGVNGALLGCMSDRTETPATPAGRTATQTHSPPAGTPTPTQGETSPAPTLPVDEPSVARRAAGTVEVSGTAMLMISNVFSLILQQAGGFFGSGSGAVAIPISCPGGGQIMVDCTQSVIPLPLPPTIGPPTYAFTADDCQVAGGAETTITLDGSMTLVGQQSGDVCFVSVPQVASLTIPALTIVAAGADGTVTTTLTGVSGSISLSGNDPQCEHNTLTAQLTGSMVLETKDPQGVTLSTTSAGLHGTTITLVVERFGPSCIPVIYRTTIDGAATFTTGGNTFAGTYSGFTVHNDHTSGAGMLAVSGAIASECFGTTVVFSTHTPVTAGNAGGCPQGGVVDAAHEGIVDRIRYTPRGGVEIDTGNDGSVDDSFESCLHPALFLCPGN